MSWATEETLGVDLKDKRLNERLVMLLEQLGSKPTLSIPAACGGYAETAAAYRFFDNPKTDFGNVLEPHIEATHRRIAEHKLVILAQDTTEIVLEKPQMVVEGAGPLDDSRRGFLLHPVAAFTPCGTPLGLVYAEAWTRPEDGISCSQKTRLERSQTPIEQKESQRWIEGYRQAMEVARAHPETQFLSVADSEADIYEFFQDTQQGPENLSWLVRAGQDRALRPDPKDEGPARYLREALTQNEVLFEQTITVRGRQAKIKKETRGRKQPRESRTAQMEVRSGQVTLRPPRRPDRRLDPVTVQAVLVSEVDPPQDDVPVEWLLLTDLPNHTNDLVRLIIAYYCVRWMMEVYFRTLKTGCQVEERRLEHIERIYPCLAIYLIVTWRTLFVCRLGREFPDLSCEAVFEPAEWKAVYAVVKKTRPPQTPPSLKDLVRLVAQLGGYINKKRQDDPGPQTVWLGLQRAYDMAQCWLAFGPKE